MRNILTLTLFSYLLFHAGFLFAGPNPWQESYRLENLYQYDAALNALNGVSSGNELALLRRGWLYYLKGSNSKSVDYYKKAIKKNSKSLDARLGMILPLMAQQRWREAASNAKKVLEVSQWNYYAHIRLMATEEALKQWSQLEKHARLVYQRYPSDADALVFLARANRKLGNNKAAAQSYQKVLEIVPSHIEAKLYIK